MKIYIKNSAENNIPEIEFDIEVYSVDFIRASAIYAEDEENIYLPEVVDKHGNVINSKWFKQYMDFIQSVESYLNSLDIEIVNPHNSAKSASRYYEFYVQDSEGNPFIKVKCNIRISDHMPGKKQRGRDFLVMNVKENTKTGIVTYKYQFITSWATSYRSCLNRLKSQITAFIDDVEQLYLEESE
ncbi:MAG: hypothetical protein NC177_16510 [Ruminococcus flavefaciens]|nr:hypothetical protein [Ruminococcus flavefaciens]MCM1508711.1 hypothetical protein [Ruminococcus flavefaciens]